MVVMPFWTNVKKEIAAQSTTQEWVARKAEVSFRTMAGWISKDRLPRVDEAHKIAMALGVSVEFLVTGKAAAGWRPPQRIESIVDDLSILPENDLQVVGRMVKSAADPYRMRLASSGGG